MIQFNIRILKKWRKNSIHIGIAVIGLEKSNELFKICLGKKHFSKTEKVAGEGVETPFFKWERQSRITQATRPDHPLQTYIDRKSEGFSSYRICGGDILAEVARLKAAGFEILNETPKKGPNNKLVVFLHRGLQMGFLGELCAKRKFERML